jgi:hypothetical protein
VTTDELMEELARRGLSLALKPDGQPSLRGDPRQVTDALRRVLRHHRERLVKRLGEGEQVVAIAEATPAPLPPEGLPLPPGPEWNTWRQVSWPTSCLESERLYRTHHARLYPLLPCGQYRNAPHGRVETVRGQGQLLSVWAERLEVALERTGVVYLATWEAWPLQEREG